MMVKSELVSELEEFLTHHNIKFHTMVEDVERYSNLYCLCWCQFYANKQNVLIYKQTIILAVKNSTLLLKYLNQHKKQLNQAKISIFYEIIIFLIKLGSRG